MHGAVLDLVDHNAELTALCAAKADRGEVAVEPLSSWELVYAAQGGDAAAFALLFRRYQRRIYGYLRLRLRDPRMAEDLTSETFLRAFRSVSTISYLGKDVSAWLITIARNIASDELGKARYRREFLTDALPDPGSDRPGPEQQVLAKVELERVRERIAALSPDQRRCLHLRFFEQFSTVETAQIMGRNAGAVRTLQSRAIRKLAGLCALDVELDRDCDAADHSEGVAA